MKQFQIITLGCKVNQYESNAISRQLQAMGWEMVSSESDPNLCIINTCAVTGKAAMQSRQEIRRAIRNHSEALILVTGCYASLAPKEIQAIDGVHIIVGHGNKHRIPELLPANGLPETIQIHSGTDMRTERTFRQFPVMVHGTRTRPVLKVQDGCNGFCTYCVVPYARGRSRSLPVTEVITQIRQLMAVGYHEVVLSGIHLGTYGLDLVPQTDLFHLLSQMDREISGIRIRLSSIEPNEFTREMIQLIAQSDLFCHHVHVPLQSGDNTILSRMHRPYTREHFLDLTKTIRQQIPDAAIGTDVLVGFPGESDAAFEHTYSLIAQSPVTYLHVFPFSPRKGTPAYQFPDKVQPARVKDRCARLRKLGDRKKIEFYRQFIGKHLDVVVETTRDNATGMLVGMASNYIPVHIDGPDKLKNTRIKAKIIGFSKDVLLAEIVL